MKAVLHTRCGCSREMDVDNDARDIKMFLGRRHSVITPPLEDLTTPYYAYRRFIFERLVRDWQGEPVAHYLEEQT